MRDRRVVVMGLGRFGGGVGVSRWLAREGAKVTVTDLADESELTESIAELQGLAIEFHLGEHDPGDLDDAELLVVNPAVDKSQSDFVQAARARGIPISSEMNLFFERCPAKIIGITGSTGKSTTAAMIFDVLYAQVKQLTGQPENVWLGGNIGESLLSDLPDMTPRDYAVLELSSFQLDDLASLGKSPQVSILTNLTPHHLDRHGSFDNYIRAKMNIFAHQSDQDFALIGEQAASVLAERGVDIGLGRRITFGPAGELAGLVERAKAAGLTRESFLPRKGDVLFWSADLVHGGSAITAPELTRKSLVGHYCPATARPYYFHYKRDRRTVREHAPAARYASAHYPL